MFSSLNQGSPLYIIEKNNGLKYNQGTVVSVSLPRMDYSNSSSFQVIDIKCSINGETREFNSIPTTYSQVTYNNGTIIISESKDGIQNAVENMVNESKECLKNKEIYQKTIEQGEIILKQINPQLARESERDERLNTLENKFNGVENKLDQILKAINNQNI